MFAQEKYDFREWQYTRNRIELNNIIIHGVKLVYYHTSEHFTAFPWSYCRLRLASLASDPAEIAGIRSLNSLEITEILTENVCSCVYVNWSSQFQSLVERK